MPKRIPEDELDMIMEAARRQGGDVTARQIAGALDAALPLRTLQYRLKHLVDAGRLVMEGRGRWARYRLAPAAGRGEIMIGPVQVEGRAEVSVPLSKEGAAIREYFRKPPGTRRP
ncbi:MAG TPA: hypothetical protein VGB36_13205, partial [Gammaproteobacteria bacterium]